MARKHPTKPAQPGELNLPPEWRGPLADAVAAGDDAVVRRLLAAGYKVPDYTGPDHEEVENRPFETLLLAAARLGHAEMVAPLVAAGEPLDGCATQYDHLTPLGAAARAGHADCVAALLHAGADPNGCEHEAFGDDLPIAAAALAGHAAVVRLLAPRVDAADRARAETLLRQRSRKRTKDDNVLLKAAAAGDAAGVAAALAAGAAVDASDKHGLTALHHAAACLVPPGPAGAPQQDRHLAVLRGFAEVVRLLVAASASLDVVGIDPPCTPLEWGISVRCGQCGPARPGDPRLEVLQTLVAAGAAINRADADGGTPLMIAAALPDPVIVQLLLDAGADPNARHASGWTPLLFTADEKARLRAGGDWRHCGYGRYLIGRAEGGPAVAARTLLAAGAAADAADPAVGTPLMWATGRVDLELVRVLLDAGADPNARHESGWTPLMYAVRPCPYVLESGLPVSRWVYPSHGANRPEAKLAAAQMLLDAGADPHARYNSGQTAAELTDPRFHLAPVVALIRDAQRAGPG